MFLSVSASAKSTKDPGQIRLTPGRQRLETLYDLFQADTARTEAGWPKNWITVACREIRSLPWYTSIPVAELEQRLKALPWWYSQLPKDKLKTVSEKQRVARAVNIRKARQAKETYAAPYAMPSAASYEASREASCEVPCDVSNEAPYLEAEQLVAG